MISLSHDIRSRGRDLSMGTQEFGQLWVMLRHMTCYYVHIWMEPQRLWNSLTFCLLANTDPSHRAVVPTLKFPG